MFHNVLCSIVIGKVPKQADEDVSCGGDLGLEGGGVGSCVNILSSTVIKTNNYCLEFG